MTTMLEMDGYSWEELTKTVDKGKKWIEDHINAYKTMVAEKVDDKDKFSHFVQVESNVEIKKITSNSDPQLKKKIIKGIKNGQFRDAKDIRKIPAICKDKNAKKKLFEYGEDCQQVYHELKSKKPMIDSPLIKVVEDLDGRLKKMKRAEVDTLSKSLRGKSKLRSVTKELLKLCKDLEIRINVPKKLS